MFNILIDDDNDYGKNDAKVGKTQLDTRKYEIWLAKKEKQKWEKLDSFIELATQHNERCNK